MPVIIAGAGVAPCQTQNPAPSRLTVQAFNDRDKGREQFQRATDMLKALALVPGDWAADVGAGDGYYSQRIAELVGPQGKVFAEEVYDSPLESLRQRAKLFGLANFEVVKGDESDPKLPADSLAAVLIVDAYHHFTEYRSMSAQILRALKPGGRLVIADYSLQENRARARADQVRMHEIDPALVKTELEAAGLKVVSCEDPFQKRIPGSASSASRADLFLMIAVRPK